MHIANRLSPPITDSFSPELKKDFNTFGKKIKEIAITIFKIIASSLLFYSNPNFLVLGLFVGLAFPDHTKALIERIRKIWKSSNYLYLGLLAGALVLAFPAGLAGLATYTGAYWGQFLVAQGEKSEESAEIYPYE